MAGRPSHRNKPRPLPKPTLPHDHRVQLEFLHRVRFTRRAFEPTNPVLAELLAADDDAPPANVFVVADQGLVSARPEMQRQIEAYFAHHTDRLPTPVGFRALPGGEIIKNDLSLLESLLGDLHRLRLDRRSFVLALGGGALLDAVGFAASVTHRGVRLVRVPTTTLAQCDSGVGVKNSVNMFGKKNFIGTFAVPFAVVNDATLLETLEDRDWRAGLAEAVKVALLKDADLYETIRASSAALRRRDAAVADPIWQRSAELHLHHITRPTEDGGGGDPFEAEAARPLDLGHWAAHKLEQLTGYGLRHGEAVAIGLALDTAYAARIGLLPPGVADDISRTLADLGFALSHPALADPALLAGLDEFREHLGGRLTLTLLRGVSDPVQVHEIDLAAMTACAAGLHARGNAVSADERRVSRRRPGC